ncbi:hypothetical protein PIB30_081021 [Stylosanthes scabra]|uniref:Uncharacterized protein n=1 Tax=Stylosanthes scabra TaxID=79078 RepID=A0ABU6XRL5_9FABA|nr:hypothetical protein [Stylosanthes scabra]
MSEGKSSGGSKDNTHALTSQTTAIVEEKQNSPSQTTQATTNVEAKDKSTVNTNVHTSKAAMNVEAKEGSEQGNWIEVKRISKTKTGEQASQRKKNNFPSKPVKGMVLGKNSKAASNKSGKGQPTAQLFGSQINTPSQFAIRKRQRPASTLSSPELRQISPVQAGSLPTKDVESIIVAVNKENALVSEVSPQLW